MTSKNKLSLEVDKEKVKDAVSALRVDVKGKMNAKSALMDTADPIREANKKAISDNEYNLQQALSFTEGDVKTEKQNSEDYQKSQKERIQSFNSQMSEELKAAEDHVKTEILP